MLRRVPYVLVAFVALVAVFACAACSRGSLSDWVRTKKETVTELPRAFGPAIDCPDGVARCIDGVVEASRLARIPVPCTKKETPGDCVCPWDVVADCPRGCASEGLSLVVPPERAAARLCAADPSKPVARPAPDAIAPPGACAGEGYRCLTSLVISCSAGEARLEAGSARVLAACLRGCAHDGDSLDFAESDADGASRILCAP